MRKRPMRPCTMCGATRRRDCDPSGHCVECECYECMTRGGYSRAEAAHANSGDEPTAPRAALVEGRGA